MALLKNIILAASLLTPVVLAAPRLDARAMVTYTETDIVWVTVEDTTTVWVEASTANPAPAAATTTITTDAVIPAVFAETTYTPSTAEAVAASPSVAVPESSAAWSSTAPAASTPAVASTPAASSSSSSANVQANSITASDSATCEGEGNACVGDVTHWDGGLGACGWNVDTNSDMEIALPYEFMGTESNDNPYCGRSLTLYNPTSGTTVQATVGDKCMGCVDRAIDCTDALFTAITDGTGNGRVSGIEWWFN